MPMLSFRRKKQSTTIQSSEISESGKRNSSSIESIRSSTAGIDEMISTRNSSAGLEFSRSKSDIQLAPPSPTRSKSDNYITVMSRRHQGQLNHQTSNNGSVVSLFNLSKLRRSFDDFRDSLVDSSHGSSSDKEVNNEKLSLLETSVKDMPLLQLPKLVSFQNNNPIEITNEIPSISVEPADIETESNHGSPLLNAICEDSVQSSIERCEETTNLSKGRNTKGILTTSSERKISLFSLSNANETSFRGPLLKFKKNKTVSKFFSLDDMLPGSMEPLQTSSNHESDISSHIQEEFASEQSSGDSSAIGPTDSRPFPLLRSLSSQSQENRDVSTDSKKTKVENRRRSRTLNSLIAENRTVAPISRPSFSSLFGSKLRSDSDPRSFNKRHSHSPRPSLSTPQEDKILLPERTYHTEDEYLRLLQNKEYGGNTALILSCQDDSFYLSVLQKYTDTFNFKDEPVDMALRKFLMYVKLPKETQQIDRILECFASTYHRQNDSIYGDSETAYIVVFSLMILHTDFFNKNNKHKMQRNDYVRNTYANGVSREILECFYDNITYTPFIHTDEDVSQPAMRPRKSSSFGRNSKDLVDPYSLMLEGRLDMIRPSLASVLKLEDPYSYPNVPSKESYRQIQKEFDQGPCLQLTSERSRPEAFLSSDTIRDNSHGVPGVVDIKVVKIGILFKREPKRMLYSKSNWKELGAILTASHLYLFKDVSWIKSAILSQSNYTNDSVISSGDGSSEEGIIKASIDGFHPSSVLSTVDMVALFSINLETSQSHAFLLAGRGGTQEAFATSSKEDMEDWMLKINYASAFNTYHIGIHSGIGSRTSPYTGHCLKPKPSFSLLSMRSDRSRVLKRDDDIDNSEIMSTRIWAVDNQLQEIQRKWKIVEEELRKQIRNGNHLKLLAPIQQRTRETVIFSAGKLAAKLDWHWLDRKRLLCYQSMFQTEKEVESELFNCSTSSVSSSSFNFDITKENGENDEKREKMEKEAHVTVSHEENDVQENSEQMNTRDLAESIASSTESVDSLTFSKGKEEITVKSIRKPVATNATETIANSDETQKAPKKGFHQRSLRSTPSKKDRHHQPIPEQHRSVSLIRKNDGDFTLHGKKFSVVQVNPEFVANPAHQRSASQHLTQILDKSKTTDSSKEESQIIANHHIDAKACEDLVNEQYSSDQNMSIDNSYT